MDTNETSAIAEIPQNTEENLWQPPERADYSADFSGKSQSEIMDMTNKDHRQLRGQAAVDWMLQRSRAAGEAWRREQAEKRAAAEAENPRSNEDLLADESGYRRFENEGLNSLALEKLIQLVEARIERSRRDRAPELPKAVTPFALPQGDVTQLLERQLASSAAMVETVARQLVEEDCSLAVCTEFMKGVTSLLGAGASVGKVVSQLRGNGAAETCHRMIVEKVVRQGEGV